MKDPHQFFAEARHARDQQTQELHENAAFIVGINALAQKIAPHLSLGVRRAIVIAILGGVALPFVMDRLEHETNKIREEARLLYDYLKKQLKKMKGQKPYTGTTQNPLESLKAANTADLKEYPGKRGEQAHKRLHREIGKLLKTKKENP